MLYFFLKASAQEWTWLKLYFFSISVVYIKEEPEDATSHVKIEPEMKPLVVTKNCFNGANYSREDIYMKEEPLQDDFVSELLDQNCIGIFIATNTFF